MKKQLLLSIIVMSGFYSFAQTNLVTNNGFESNFTGWFSTTANGNLWAGIGACTPAAGARDCWFADQNQLTGLNSANDDIYQTFTIPTNLAGCQLTFNASINTLETTTTQFYDSLLIRLRSTTGALLHDFGFLSNLNGAFGIPGCQASINYSSPNLVPASLYGQTVRLSFEFVNDNSNPTIFRIDEVALTAFPACVYSLSTSNYTCPNGSATTHSNVAAVNVQNYCIWTASVVTGGSWLTCTSTDTGNGNVDITVTQNLGPPRIGTIDVNGQLLTINQPSGCSYSLSQSTYSAPDHLANTYNNIASVTAQAGCPWSAVVTSGGSWLSTNSSGAGNGTLSVTVTANAGSQRSGTVEVNGQIITITQPEEVNCTYGLSSSSYTLPDNKAGSQSSIVLVNTQANCTWTATVSPGSSWLACSSAGNGSGAIDIVVLVNNTGAIRTGTIDVEGELLTVIQPPEGVTNGLNELNSSSYKIFPSPAKEVLTISIEDYSGENTYQILDQNGRVLLFDSFTSDQIQLNVERLKPGLYFVRLRSDKSIKRFIKE